MEGNCSQLGKKWEGPGPGVDGADAQTCLDPRPALALELKSLTNDLPKD